MTDLPELGPDEALARVRAGAKLIDVRERDEWDAVHAPEAVLLPMSELQERLGELPHDEELLIVCHSGARSARVTAFLNREGYDAANVAGGMLAWPGEVVSEGPSAPTG
ncbi:MAG TPA: rhodanese-like domain-containing protein [Rhodoglobus sp.]|nr:rhodanese-like domain-containing protein [Rhodoglobus sp.]